MGFGCWTTGGTEQRGQVRCAPWRPRGLLWGSFLCSVGKGNPNRTKQTYCVQTENLRKPGQPESSGQSTKELPKCARDLPSKSSSEYWSAQRNTLEQGKKHQKDAGKKILEGRLVHVPTIKLDKHNEQGIRIFKTDTASVMEKGSPKLNLL